MRPCLAFAILGFRDPDPCISNARDLVMAAAWTQLAYTASVTDDAFTSRMCMLHSIELVVVEENGCALLL